VGRVTSRPRLCTSEAISAICGCRIRNQGRWRVGIRLLMIEPSTAKSKWQRWLGRDKTVYAGGIHVRSKVMIHVTIRLSSSRSDRIGKLVGRSEPMNRAFANTLLRHTGPFVRQHHGIGEVVVRAGCRTGLPFASKSTAMSLAVSPTVRRRRYTDRVRFQQNGPCNSYALNLDIALRRRFRLLPVVKLRLEFHSIQG